MEILQTIHSIGDWVSSNIVGSILAWLDSQKILVSPITSKIISILVFLGLIWLSLSLVDKIKKPLGWILVVILAFVLISIGISLFT